jgi:hypothetical protein
MQKDAISAAFRPQNMDIIPQLLLGAAARWNATCFAAAPFRKIYDFYRKYAGNLLYIFFV